MVEESGQRSPRVVAWGRFLTELDWWVERHGDAAVPQAGVSYAQVEAYPLGRRVKVHRVAYHRGVLAADRVRTMESRPGWSWEGHAARSSRSWQRQLAAVRAYVAENGSLEGLEAANAPVARWLRQQRTEPLTPAQGRELRRIRGALQDRKGRFAEFVAALRGWMAIGPDRDAGAIRFSTVYRVGRAEYPLGRRTAYWRSRHAAGRLSTTEIETLSSLPGWRWDPPSVEKLRSDGRQ